MSILTAPLGLKRFLGIGLLSFISIYGVVWLWVAEEPLAYLDLNYPAWLAKMTLVKEGRSGNLVILGDSSPCADLVPDRLGPGVVNLGLLGASPIEGYILGRSVITDSIRPQAVILSYSPLKFMNSDLFWSYGVGFDLLHWRDIEEVRSRSRTLGDTSLFDSGSPGDIDARLKSFLYSIKFPSFYFPALIHARVFGRYAGNAEQLKLVLANRGYIGFGQADGSIEPDMVVDIKSFIPDKILDDYFDRTVALFHAHNIPVYFISMPRNEVSFRHYAPGLKEAFTSYLDQYVRRYPNFHVLGDPLPVYPSRYYGDSSHLNKDGAILWSDSVAKLLNDAHVEGGPFGAVENEPAR